MGGSRTEARGLQRLPSLLLGPGAGDGEASPGSAVHVPWRAGGAAGDSGLERAPTCRRGRPGAGGELGGACVCGVVTWSQSRGSTTDRSPPRGRLLLRARMGLCADAYLFFLFSVFGEVVTWAGRAER